MLPEVIGQPKNVAIAKNRRIILVSAGHNLTLLDMDGTVISPVTMPEIIYTNVQMDTGRVIPKLIKREEDICHIAISDDGTTSVSLTGNGCPWRTIQALSVTDITGKPLFSYTSDKGFMGVALSGNGSVIAGIDEYRLHVFHRNGTLVWNYTSSPQFRSVGISSDGQYIAAGSQYFLRFFKSDGKLLWTYYDRSGWVRAVTVSDTGDFVLIGMSKEYERLPDELLLFDRNGTLIWHYPVPSPIRSVSSSGDGKYFAAATKNHVYFFNRQGDAMVPDTPDYPDISVGTPQPGQVTVPQPAPKSSPVCWPVFSVAGCVITAILLRRRSAHPPMDEA